jgi:hypothetical protein
MHLYRVCTWCASRCVRSASGRVEVNGRSSYVVGESTEDALTVARRSLPSAPLRSAPLPSPPLPSPPPPLPSTADRLPHPIPAAPYDCAATRSRRRRPQLRAEHASAQQARQGRDEREGGAPRLTDASVRPLAYSQYPQATSPEHPRGSAPSSPGVKPCRAPNAACTATAGTRTNAQQRSCKSASAAAGDCGAIQSR